MSTPEDVIADPGSSEWKLRQTIALGWNDGPVEGVCALAHPRREFVFWLLDERYNPDGLDDRLYALCELPIGTVDKILSLLTILGSPCNSVWVPVWIFPSDQQKEEVEKEIDNLLKSARPANIIVHSRDFRTILGRWQLEAIPSDVKDWFKLLKIS